jgi:hypothetical protein
MNHPPQNKVPDANPAPCREKLSYEAPEIVDLGDVNEFSVSYGVSIRVGG